VRCLSIEHDVQKTPRIGTARRNHSHTTVNATHFREMGYGWHYRRDQPSICHWHPIRTPSASGDETGWRLSWLQGQIMSHTSPITLEAPLRPASARKKPIRLRSVRPSVLDLRFCGDPWIVAGEDGQFALCLGDYNLASIDSLELDLPALNALLDQVRHRRPRYHAVVPRNIR
jgi:hypothetical protein